MRKKILKNLLKTCVFTVLATLTFNSSHAQVDGDYRSKTNGGGWSTAATWQIFTLATNTWANNPSTGPLPTASTNVTIRDGFNHTGNANGNVAGTLTVGEGGGFRANGVLIGGVLTGVTILDPGKLIVLSGISIFGSATTLASATIASVKLSGTVAIAQGSGYTTATVKVGNFWVASAPYLANAQVNSGGNLYTCKTAGTSDVSTGPTVTGTGIADGTVVWDYAGPAATATVNIIGGQITSLSITNQGSGYLSIPSISITGDGTLASYAPQVGVVALNITSGGAGYTEAPSIIAGTYFQVGNGTTPRSMIVYGDVSVKSGGNFVSGVAQTLTIGGNLSAVTPISFRTVSGTTTGNTNVVFNKAGIATLSGARMVFNNLTINTGTTVNITCEVIILGTLTNNGTLMGSYATTLPIKLTSFLAKVTSNHVNVSWATSSEINNDKFVVERSADGENFLKLGEVAAKGASAYSFVDHSPAKGTNYYRLVQYDLDGKSEVFGPVAVNFDLKASTSLMAYPNPTPGSISFNADGLNGNIEALLLDMSGKVIYQESINNTGERNYTLNMKQKPVAGQYILQVNGKGFNKSTMIVVL